MPYLASDEVRGLYQAVGKYRQGERDALLIRLLFETGLRISEALQIALKHLEHFQGRPVPRILGKGSKPRLVASPKGLAESLQAYAYRHELQRDQSTTPRGGSPARWSPCGYP